MTILQIIGEYECELWPVTFFLAAKSRRIEVYCNLVGLAVLIVRASPGGGLAGRERGGIFNT